MKVLEIVLKGRRVRFRPIQASDREPLQRGLQKLGPQSRRLRFHGERNRFTASELDHLVECDGVDRIAYVALELNLYGQEIDEVGVARAYRKADDATCAEVAVVVVDGWQRSGAGTALLQQLSEHCLQQEICFWQADILGENEVAVRLFESFGTIVARRWSGGVQELIIELKVLAVE